MDGWVHISLQADMLTDPCLHHYYDLSLGGVHRWQLKLKINGGEENQWQ